MHNMVYLIGRIANDLETVDNKCKMTVAVQRAYKNEEGIYETDMVPCELFGNVANNTAEYCTKGDLVGIKGNIQATDGNIRVVVDKISFLASKRTNEDESELEEE